MQFISELLTRLVNITAVPAMAGVLGTALLLLVSRDWRLNILALAAQYFFVMLLMTRTVRVEMAAVKGLIGWVTCLVFYVTEQQAHVAMRSGDASETLSLEPWFRARLEGWRTEGISAQAAFSFMAAAVVGVAALALATSVPLPEVSTGLALVCYLLSGFGVLLLGLSDEPLRVGVGLLMFLSGFDLCYTALEPSLIVTGLLGAIMFVVALGTAYLKSSETVTGDGAALQ